MKTSAGKKPAYKKKKRELNQFVEMMACRNFHLKDTEPYTAENEPPPRWYEAHS